jgi:hypothetical protein
MPTLQQSGGPRSAEKAEWLEEVTEQWFLENKDIEPHELEEDFLEGILMEEFNLQIDDGSLAEVRVRPCP